MSKNQPFFESGKVVLSTGDTEVLEINMSGKRINVDVEDKAFIKRVIGLRREISELTSSKENEQKKVDKKKKSSGPLATLKSIAEMLSSRNITLTLSYRDDILVTLGADAKPTMLQLITKTKAVSINSFYKLIRLVL